MKPVRCLACLKENSKDHNRWIKDIEMNLQANVKLAFSTGEGSYHPSDRICVAMLSIYIQLLEL